MKLLRWLAPLALLATGEAAPPSSDPVVAATLVTLPRYAPGPRVTGTIRVWGHGSPKHDFVGDLVRRWFAEFQRGQPDVKLDYRMYGTASAIGALATGQGNLAILGEEISPDAERLFERAHGYAPTRIDVANGSVDTNYFDYAHMVFVRRDNPLAKLTARQLEGIFGAEGRCGGAPIRRWGALGLRGVWADMPITPYGWKADVDFGLFIRERILCGSHRWNPALREFMPVTRPDGTSYEHGQQIIDALAKDRYGIAISSMRFATPQVKAIALAWNARGPFVAATSATLIARRYPLGRIIPAFVDKAPGRPLDPAVREFLRYILSREGQTALAEQSGYLPLDAPTAARERTRLQ